MGDTPSTTNSHPYLQSLTHIQQANDINFGSVQVYRTSEPPLQYLMDRTTTFMDQQDKAQECVQNFKRLMTINHRNISKMVHCEVTEALNVCVQSLEVHVFSQYLNFTLSDAISKKRAMGGCFSPAQLLYIASSMLQIALVLERQGLVLGDYRSQRVYLTPEGYIKVYLVDVDLNHKHTTYHKALSCPKSHPEYCLSPEQLRDLIQLAFVPTKDFYQSEVHSIGMLMMELMTLDHPKHFYSSENTSINTDKIYYQLQHSAYSQNISQIVAKMLHPDPQHRCTFKQALNLVEQAKRGTNTVHAIKLQEPHNQHKKQQPSIDLRHSLSRHKKQSKLRPMAIDTLANSNATSQHKIDGAVTTNSSWGEFP